MQPARQSGAEQPTGAKTVDDRLPRDKGVEGTWGIDSEAGPCFTRAVKVARKEGKLYLP